MTTLYCVPCEAHQDGTEGDPCFLCRTPGSKIRPKSWPTLNGPRMRPEDSSDSP